MSILSFYFLVFLGIMTILYYIVPKVARPYVLLCASIFFYIQFDLRYSIFLLFSTISIYLCALWVSKSKSKAPCVLAILSNVALMLYVKFMPYIAGMSEAHLGIKIPSIFTKVIVPVGMSFYTLALIGYIIDVYRGKYGAEKNFFRFLSFSIFFPLMLQGPISRYDQLAPQLWQKERPKNIYHNITYGSQLMLWGFFQKLVIADRVGMLVNEVFASPSDYSSKALVIAAIGYAIQIYTDFSGCVDICRGAAQLMGIDVIKNFNMPYFSCSIAEFWRRWHMSLSSWFRDYIYIPLGGNRKGTFRKYLNVIIVFFASGIWHGVGLHYLVWGVLQGVYQVMGALTSPIKDKACSLVKLSRKSVILKPIQIVITFALTTFTWIFFRANSLTSAFIYIGKMFSFTPGDVQSVALDTKDYIVLGVAIAILFATSVVRYNGVGVRDLVAKRIIVVRWIAYLALFVIVLIFGIYGPGYSGSSFIYMNF